MAKKRLGPQIDCDECDAKYHYRKVACPKCGAKNRHRKKREAAIAVDQFGITLDTAAAFADKLGGYDSAIRMLESVADFEGKMGGRDRAIQILKKLKSLQSRATV